MKIDLDQILALAGDLEQKDSRKRFQSFLAEVAKDSDPIRELAASALKVSDLQNRLALQDLVLSLGTQLGFEPGLTFGGHWRSPASVIFLLELVAGDEPLDLAALFGRAEAAKKEELKDKDGAAVVGPAEEDRPGPDGERRPGNYGASLDLRTGAGRAHIKPQGSDGAKDGRKGRRPPREEGRAPESEVLRRPPPLEVDKLLGSADEEVWELHHR
jgi:hypothetical protein